MNYSSLVPNHPLSRLTTALHLPITHHSLSHNKQNADHCGKGEGRLDTVSVKMSLPLESKVYTSKVLRGEILNWCCCVYWKTVVKNVICTYI